MKKEENGKNSGAFEKEIASLKENVTSLKRQLAGCKGRNKQLTEEVCKWKAYGEESDLLNEQKAERVYGLEKEIAEKKEYCKVLESKVCSLEAEKSELLDIIGKNKALPWYKRIFGYK
jgi:predicted RNase H-like nuclease (RuvC/YqgF family)